MVVIAAVCGVGALPGGVVLPQTSGDWVAMVHIALVAGALSLVAQAWAQAHLTATRAAVVMTMEPVFAASFAVLLGGELLTARMRIGGALVLTAVSVVELGPRRGCDAGVTHLVT